MKTLKYLGVALLATQLTACFDAGNKLPTPNTGNDDNGSITEPEIVERLAYNAAIQTVDAFYMPESGMHIAQMNQDGKSLVLSNEILQQSASDYTVSAYKNHFYQIGRFGIDTIAKYAFDNPVDNIFGSTFDIKGSDSDANTYELVTLNENKAYLIRYGSDKVWIVNPSATTEAEFKIGELDLSAYAATEPNGDGVPEMSAAKIVGDKLFILMQRLDDWCPTEDAFIAVFDTKTDTEINVNSAKDPDGLKGIRLAVKNPESLDFNEDIGLVVAGVGAGTIFSCTPPNRYSGGIEVVHPGNYQTKLLIDDGDESNHPYDFISQAVVLDKNNGYFVSYVDWGETKLYHFNPTTGDVSGVVSGFGDTEPVDIRVLEKSPENTAWVGLAAAWGVSDSGQIYILDKEQDVDEYIDLPDQRNPEAIAFAYEKTLPIMLVQHPFAPAHNVEGTTAIPHDDERFVAWATGWENYKVGTEVTPNWQTPEQALGVPGNSDGSDKGFTFDIVVLGSGGEITLTFDKPIRNGEGADFAVFENSFDHKFLELAWVEVSSDGENFFRFPNYSFTENPVAAFGAVEATNIHNLAGKYQGGYGTPFDLEDLKGTEGLDVNNITHVKLVDIVGNGTALDSLGNIIYEPYKTVGSGGFDLDAIGVIHQAD